MVGDTERVLKSEKTSAIGVLTRGGSAARVGGYTDEEPHRRWVVWITIGAVIVVVALGGLFFWFAARPASEPVITAPPSAIRATETEIIQLTGKAGAERSTFLSAWNAFFKRPLSSSEFRSVSVLDAATSVFFTAREFLELLGAAPPPLLVNGLRDPFTLGILRTDRDGETVLIFGVRSFSEAFAGMLAWERDLPRSLAALLAPGISPDRGSNIFTDVVVSNHDVRLLKNTAGQPILLYTIFNRQTLIITQSPNALEIVLRQLSFFPPS